MQSENHGQYAAKRPLSVGPRARLSIQESHFALGAPEKGSYMTTYQTSCPGHQVAKKSQSVGKLALKSSLNLGRSGDRQYTTEFKSQ